MQTKDMPPLNLGLIQMRCTRHSHTHLDQQHSRSHGGGTPNRRRGYECNSTGRTTRRARRRRSICRARNRTAHTGLHARGMAADARILALETGLCCPGRRRRHAAQTRQCHRSTAPVHADCACRHGRSCEECSRGV